jgi:hypothetical protein
VPLMSALRLALYGLLAFVLTGAAGPILVGGGGLASTDLDTSAELATVLTDETGSGAACFATSPTFTTSIQSDNADVADSGFFRLGNAQSICWESSPAGTDNCLTVDSSERLDFSTGGSATLRFGILESTNSDPADAGVIRLGNAQSIAWEANPTGTDVTIAVNQSEQFVFANNVGGFILPLRQADLGTTCTLGEWAYDTGGAADELCYCQATDTWMCVTAAAGPAD